VPHYQRYLTYIVTADIDILIWNVNLKQLFIYFGYGYEIVPIILLINNIWIDLITHVEIV